MIKSKKLTFSVALNLFLLISIILILYFNHDRKFNETQKNTTSENKFFEFGQNQTIHLIINGNDGLIDYNDDDGNISIAWKDAKRNVIYKMNDGQYSFLADKNGNGFADVGVLRSNNARVQFSYKSMPIEKVIQGN